MDVPTSGTWMVKTEASVYMFDFELGLGMRLPDDPMDGLRRDGLQFPLHKMDRLEIGEPMEMWITVEEGVFTYRMTTPVMAIVGPIEALADDFPN